MVERREIEAIKSRIDIAELITRSGVTLSPSGIGSYKGLCPFHDERTPSFTVRPANGYFNCFGCGVKGDIFEYINRKDGIPFMEAVEMLAAEAGVTITRTHTPQEEKSSPRARIMDVLSVTAMLFQENFKQLNDAHPAKVELFSRNLLDQTDGFGVGYAPEGWTTTLDTLKARGFTQQEVLDAGVASTASTGRVFDLFRGRLTWEIRDITGRVIGFGARRIFDTDKGPKYLNSPQTLVYDKSKVLYGIDLARKQSVSDKKLHVVEGYTDVMASHAAGYTNTVASCGTAFGDSHARIAQRLIGEGGKFVFSFDDDSAGQNAARKTFSLATPIHSRAFVSVSRDGDPCDIRQNYGDEALRNMLDDQVPLTEFVLRFELAKHDVSTTEGSSTFLHAALPLVNSLPDEALREGYFRQVALWSGSTLSTVKSMASRAGVDEKRANPAPQIHEEEQGEEKPAPRRVGTLEARERMLLALSMQYPAWAREITLQHIVPEVFTPELQQQAREVRSAAEKGLTRLVAEHFTDPGLAQEIFMLESPLSERTRDPEMAVKRHLLTLLRNVNALRSKRESARIRATISGERNPDVAASLLQGVEEQQMALRLRDRL